MYLAQSQERCSSPTVDVLQALQQIYKIHRSIDLVKTARNVYRIHALSQRQDRKTPRFHEVLGLYDSLKKEYAIITIIQH